MQAALPLGQDGLAALVMLDTSVTDIDAVWSLWQSSTGELQCRSLKFWSKVLPYSADNYSFLEKCSWPVGRP